MTTEVGVDWESKAWGTFCSKRWPKQSEPTIGQLRDLVGMLHEVKSGKLKFVMTPDGILTKLPY